MGQCYYPSVRTENTALLVLFSVRPERWIDLSLDQLGISADDNIRLVRHFIKCILFTYLQLPQHKFCQIYESEDVI